MSQVHWKNQNEIPPESEQDKDALQAVSDRYPVRVSSVMRRLIAADPDGPVARQFLPDAAELRDHDFADPDPIGDEKHSPVPGIVHRHQNRVLLKAIHSCPVYCRFCFRKEMVGPNGHMLNSPELKAALDYIERVPQISEVILSGGDPLMLSARRLNQICERLHNTDHLDNIRIHSRVPTVSPEMMTDDKIQALKGRLPVYIVLHINHADEFTPEGTAICRKLSESGIQLLCESVLLKGVNDSVRALEELSRACIRHRIKPYYLHHLDHAPGTEHFRVCVKTGQALMKELMRSLSGIAVPSYVLDLPGGHAKIPLGHCKIEDKGQGHYRIEDPDGHLHDYIDTAITAGN